MGNIGKRIERVKENMEDSAAKEGRKREEITLVAVSKTRDLSAIVEAADGGIECFGENYIQEAGEKISAIERPLKWHLVGHLQANKAKKAVRLFDMIETVDSVSVAHEISARALSAGKIVPILVQVNVAEESSKWGVLQNDLVTLLEEIALLPGIIMSGLMTIPPYTEDPEDARPFFIALRELRDKINDMEIEGISLHDLSMGMSHDYQVAIEEGATIIRVGTAIFGRRKV